MQHKLQVTYVLPMQIEGYIRKSPALSTIHVVQGGIRLFQRRKKRLLQCYANLLLICTALLNLDYEYVFMESSALEF